MTVKFIGIADYYQGLTEGKIVASKCNKCDDVYLPPRPICSTCQARDMILKELRGEGRIIGHTTVAVPPSNMVDKGFSYDRRYVTAIVALDQGAIIAGLIDMTGSECDGEVIHVGMAVRAHFLVQPDRSQNEPVLVFRPM